MSLPFGEYARSRGRRYTPAGAFLATLINDDEFTSITTREELDAFLMRRELGANHRMFARDLWDRYARAKRREAKRQQSNSI